ncbi:MAG: hypothetical protein IPG12_10855 [Saprospiraceae bacterium]|nr:hypothetical protein [Saprospiraceae bacterium]
MSKFKNEFNTDLKGRVIKEFLDELQKKGIPERQIELLRIELSKSSISETTIREILLEEEQGL